MAKTMISVRDVDEETFRKFRSMTIEQRMKLGEALTKAMRKLIKEKNKQTSIKSPKIKPFSWGQGSENTSKEIDKILYS